MEKKKKVLLVDDDPGVTNMLRRALELTNLFVAVENNDPEMTITAAEQLKPDLILLDIILPGTDGGRIRQKLQLHPRLRKVPVIFLTASVTPEEIQSRKGLIGGQPFISKTQPLSEIISIVKSRSFPA